MTKKLFALLFASIASRTLPCCLALACALALVCPDVFAADGDPDPTFGFNGRAYIPWVRGIPDAADTIAVLSQTDGKVILVGNVNVYSGFDDQDGNPINTNCIGVTRELVNGQMDPGFGTNGYFLIDNDPRADHDIHAYAATLDIHGRIMIAGYDNDGPNQRKSAAIWAVKPNGSMLDPSFGSNGQYILDRGRDDSRDTLLAIYAPQMADIQAGTLHGYLVAGLENNGDDTDYGMFAEITTAGALFGTSESTWSSTIPGCTSTTGNALAFKTSGPDQYVAYVAGNSVCGGYRRATVHRLIWAGNWQIPDSYTSEFVFDWANDAGGLPLSSAATSIALGDASDYPLVGGYVYSSDLHTPKNMAVARPTVGGNFDPSFNGGVPVVIDWGDSEYTWVNTVRIQHDGKILLGGNEMLMLPGIPAQSAFALVRLHGNGIADTGFGNRFGVEGANDYNFPLHGDFSPTPRVAAMAFTEGENILFGGYVQDPAALQNTYFATMRIRNGPIVVDDSIFRNGFDS
jgi:uncharacterized delta-60 repeat protein